MSSINKIKKVLKKENFKKDDEIQRQINSLKKENKKLSQSLKELEKKHESILDSYNVLFNNIYIYHNLAPINLIDNNRQLILELLEFINQVCLKYDLQWWLYAGSLLGAIRHEGFIPWDDDCDINMMRNDYEKFLEVINLEVEKYNLDQYIKVKNSAIIHKSVAPFTKIDYWVDGSLLGFIDIFPSDFVSTIDDDIKTIYLEEYRRIRKELTDGKDRKSVLKETFERLNIIIEESEFIITGVEGDFNFFHIYKYEDIFPLQLKKFENKFFPCPNNLTEYIKSLYGENYMLVPKSIKNHNFHQRLLNTENCNEKLVEHIKLLKEVNKSFC